MTERATAWSVTINMKTVSRSTADECINQARSRGWKVEGQLEQGEEGTQHYQLLVRTPQTRFSAIKKAFPTAHIEIARNVDALREYVNKEATRTGSLPTPNDKYPSVTKMWELFWDHIPTKEWFTGTLEDIKMYARDLPVGDKARLQYLDETGAHLIQQGYYIEQHLVNPQVRSSFTKFASELCVRTLKKLVEDADRRQTDRHVEIEPQVIDIQTTDGEDTSQVDEEHEEQEDEDGDSVEDGDSDTDEDSEETGEESD